MALSADQIIYHGVSYSSVIPPRYLRLVGKAPLTEEGYTQIGTANAGASGIWGFGVGDETDLWVCGNPHATESQSMTLWRTQNQGTSWTQEHDRIPSPPIKWYNNLKGYSLWGYGDSADGKLWLPIKQSPFAHAVICQAPDPLGENNFIQRYMEPVLNGGWVWSHGAYSEEFGLMGWAMWYYVQDWVMTTDGINWSEDAYNGLPASFIYADGVWVDAVHNRVYVIGFDNVAGTPWKCFWKPANDKTSAWTLDHTFGDNYFYADSAAGYRHMHGDPVSGAVYYWNSSQSTCELWRRDPDLGTWSMVKSFAASGNAYGLWVLDDENLLAIGSSVAIQKDSEGYHTYANTGSPDYPWTYSQRPGNLWGPTYPSAVSIDTVDPDPITTAGGHLITLTGTFPALESLPTRLGLAGDNTDPLCYGGQGYGYSPVSLDGLTLTFVSPPSVKGSATITINYDDFDYQASITVVERNWPEKLHGSRKHFPGWQAVGNRRLELEDLE